MREVERPIADIVQVLEGPGNAATSAENNDRFRILSNIINVLENRAKARRRALLMVSCCPSCCMYYILYCTVASDVCPSFHLSVWGRFVLPGYICVLTPTEGGC